MDQQLVHLGVHGSVRSSPVCVFMCSSKYCFMLKSLPHHWHMNCLWPMWMLMWERSWYLYWNRSSQFWGRETISERKTHSDEWADTHKTKQSKHLSHALSLDSTTWEKKLNKKHLKAEEFQSSLNFSLTCVICQYLTAWEETARQKSSKKRTPNNKFKTLFCYFWS